MSIIVAADTGGTFTDLAAYDRERRRIVISKSLTTYDDLTEGVMDCVRKAGVDLARAEMVKFGTTLVINTYLQRNGARTALVTTRGFRDVLEIRRGNRPIPFDLRYMRDPVLVPRDLRLEVTERIDSAGTVQTPLSHTELGEIAAMLAELRVEAVAVSFLNAYADSTHEEAAVQVLRAALPGVFITAATDVSREWYEYERTSTAAANAYVGPRVGDYVTRLDRRLQQEGYPTASSSWRPMAASSPPGVPSASRSCWWSPGLSAAASAPAPTRESWVCRKPSPSTWVAPPRNARCWRTAPSR